jgi:hypothetical protein
MKPTGVVVRLTGSSAPGQALGHSSDTPRAGTVTSEIALVLVLHLTIALAVVSTLVAFGIG